jgi:hypothetical protein
MLARPGVDEIGGGKFHAAVALLDDKAGDAAPTQLGGQRETRGTASSDQYRP